MIRPIVRDIFFLGQKSDPATKQDLSVGQDLMDTLKANQDRVSVPALSDAQQSGYGFITG